MKKIIFSAVAACTLSLSANAQDKATLAPDAAVQTWGQDMAAGNTTSLWDSLPKKYQADSNALIQAFGNQVDAAVYKEAIVTLTKANNLLKSKKALILEIMEDEMPADNAEAAKKFNAMKANYSNVTDLFDTILKSEVKDADGLKTFDAGKFHATIEPQMKTLATAMLAMKEDCDIKDFVVKLISNDGAKAVVEASVPKKDAKKVELTRVGERWVPSKLASDWDAKVAKAKKGIAGMKKLTPEQAMQVTMVMQVVQMTIAELDKAQTAEELKAAVEGQMKKFAPMLKGKGKADFL